MIDSIDLNRSAQGTLAAKNIAAIPAKSIPILGLAVLIADTSYELYAACEMVTDLDQLYIDPVGGELVIHLGIN